ncbi:MAG: hypothetical protein LWY06_04820 [Firmicutes bacterium]|nr:hypothetical protein [Bacillota bacterium]
MKKIASKWITFVSVLIVFVSACFFYFRHYQPVYNEWFFTVSENEGNIALLRMESQAGSENYHYAIWTCKPSGEGMKKACRIPDEYQPDQNSPKMMFWVNRQIMLVVKDKDGMRNILVISPETGKAEPWSHGPIDEKVLDACNSGVLTARQLEYNFYYILLRKFGEKDFTRFGRVRSGDLLTKSTISQDASMSAVIESYTDGSTPTEINSVMIFKAGTDNEEQKPEGLAVNDILISNPEFHDNGNKLTFIANNGFYIYDIKQAREPLRLFKIQDQFRMRYCYDEPGQNVYIPSVKQGIIYKLDLKNNVIHTINTGTTVAAPMELSGDRQALFFLTPDVKGNFSLCRFDLTGNTLKYLSSCSKFEGRHTNNDKIKKAITERSNGLKSFTEIKPSKGNITPPGEDSPSGNSVKTENI